MRRQLAELGEPAVPHLADQPAVADAVGRVDQHALADFPVAHRRTERHDLAGEIVAHDARHRHLDAGHAAPREEIVIVERSRAHAHDRIVRTRHRIRKVRFVFDRAGSAVLVDDRCFHVSVCLIGEINGARRRRVPGDPDAASTIFAPTPFASWPSFTPTPRLARKARVFARLSTRKPIPTGLGNGGVGARGVPCAHAAGVITQTEPRASARRYSPSAVGSAAIPNNNANLSAVARASAAQMNTSLSAVTPFG